MTVADLIDYLSQFEGETQVLLSSKQVPEDDNYIILNVLDFEYVSAEDYEAWPGNQEVSNAGM